MPRSVICAVDASDSSSAVDVAARVSEALGLGLVLAHVADGIPAPGGDGTESLTTAQDRHGARRLVERVAAEHGLAGIAKGRADVGRPASRLAEIATEERAALIVVGARKAGLFRSALKSGLAEELAALAPCPVVVAPPRPIPVLAEAERDHGAGQQDKRR